MARRRPIYSNNAAERFRRIVRPAMFGRIALVEPIITGAMAEAFAEWLFELINRVMRETDLNDEQRQIRSQLISGIRVIGRTSMRTLEGRIDAYPWIFPHEYGGTLRPTNARALTIPIYHALRPDGRPKFRSANSWRRFGSFIYTPKGSERSYIAYKSANRELRILYVLVDEVEIPARLGLNRMASATLGNLLVQWKQIFVLYAAMYGISNPWLGER